MRRCVSEANGGWWHTDQYYTLEQTSAAEGAIQPQRCLSALWYTLGERGGGMGGEVGFDGYMLLKQRMAAGPVCVRERDCSQKARARKKACSLWGIDFYLWHDVIFRSVTPAVLCVRLRFSSPHFFSMQMNLTAFLSNKERNQDMVEALFVCHHTVTFLLISGPAAR